MPSYVFRRIGVRIMQLCGGCRHLAAVRAARGPVMAPEGVWVVCGSTRIQQGVKSSSRVQNLQRKRCLNSQSVGDMKRWGVTSF